MPTTWIVRVLIVALVLLVLLSWFKTDIEIALTLTKTTTTVAPRASVSSETATEGVDFEDPPAPCNDEPEIIAASAKPPLGRFLRSGVAEMHVISAFLDSREDREVLIIGRAPGTGEETFDGLRCLFVDGREVWRSSANVELESGFAGLNPRYHTAFIRCHVDRPLGKAAKVGLTFNNCDGSPVYLEVQHIPSSRQVAHGSGLELCVRPFPPLYNDVSQLADFVELHRHLGVQHFNFYVSDQSAEVRTLLDSYTRDGIASMVTWNGLPPSDDDHSELERFGSDTLAMQDCLYRRMNRLHPFLGFIGVTEAFLPATNPYNSSLASLVHALLTQDTKHAALRIRHRHPASSSITRRRVQPKSQWIVRSNLIFSLQAYWIGRYFRGIGLDVSPNHAVVQPLADWTSGGLPSALVATVNHRASLRKKR